jgi:hypothetical protein
MGLMEGAYRPLPGNEPEGPEGEFNQTAVFSSWSAIIQLLAESFVSSRGDFVAEGHHKMLRRLALALGNCLVWIIERTDAR